MVHNPSIVAMGGSDYELYMGATSRWLAGGPFYLPQQLAGSYTVAIRPVMYPPQALVLFVPFTVLPTALWFAIPMILTVGMMLWHRPNRWGWLATGALVAGFPMLFLGYLAGTPTIWIVAFLALGTRWPWVAAFILGKPTLLPFALIGVSNKRWWAIAALLGLLGIVLWPLTLDWIRAGLNLSGSRSGLVYSFEDVPVMLVPIIAWVTGRHRPALSFPTRMSVFRSLRLPSA